MLCQLRHVAHQYTAVFRRRQKAKRLPLFVLVDHTIFHTPYIGVVMAPVVSRNKTTIYQG
jgi:hypothetical protein